jgi:hypothetical protein
MTISTFVVLLGVLSSITLIISALSVHRKRLLTFGIATGSIVAVQYGLMDNWVGLMTLSIGLVWTLMMLFSIKNPWLNHWLFIPLFMGFHLLSFSLLSDWNSMTWVNFIPLIGGWGGVIAIFFKNMIYTKSLLIAFGAMWLVYEFHSGIYGQMIGESLNLVANSVALTMLVVAARRGIPEALIDDVIDTITSSIPVITSSIHLPQLHTRSIHLPVRVSHDSVHYARRKAESERVSI